MTGREESRDWEREREIERERSARFQSKQKPSVAITSYNYKLQHIVKIFVDKYFLPYNDL